MTIHPVLKYCHKCKRWVKAWSGTTKWCKACRKEEYRKSQAVSKIRHLRKRRAERMRSKKIQHVGVSAHRLKSNPMEKVFAEAWKERNDPVSYRPIGTLQTLLCSKGDGIIERELTQEEATAAATVIQWLGSPVGFSWLRQTLENTKKFGGVCCKGMEL